MALAQASFEYKGDPEKTNANRRDGFFTVGDVGVLDDDGYLFLRDRKIDMIICGGVNIYPAEIEGTFLTFPQVGDVAVFGIPNEDWGEEIKAVVEPAEGQEAGDRARGAAPRVRRGEPGVVQAPEVLRLHRRDAPRPERQALQAQAPRPVLGRRDSARSEPLRTPGRNGRYGHPFRTNIAGSRSVVLVEQQVGGDLELVAHVVDPVPAVDPADQ